MKARNLPGRALLWWTLCVSSPLCAASGVVRWENTFRQPLAGSGFQSVFTARELADGTTLVVAQDNYGFTTLQYDHAGNQLSAATFYPVYLEYPFLVSIDPFGAVFFATVTSNPELTSSDLWMMKYDGLTGAALWPSGVILGAGNHADDVPLELMVDPAGDVVL
ncbi:MAG TPA: hypothetical protein VFA98_02930, partial [Thermoanaerobaculia bacterium]|nr:hypothetical protein [Thermoanaerobaculia bacterium]